MQRMMLMGSFDIGQALIAALGVVLTAMLTICGIGIKKVYSSWSTGKSHQLWVIYKLAAVDAGDDDKRLQKILKEFVAHHHHDARKASVSEANERDQLDLFLSLKAVDDNRRNELSDSFFESVLEGMEGSPCQELNGRAQRWKEARQKLAMEVSGPAVKAAERSPAMAAKVELSSRDRYLLVIQTYDEDYAITQEPVARQFFGLRRSILVMGKLK